MEELTIVMQLFNRSTTVYGDTRELISALSQSGIEVGLLLVDNGSRDGTWYEICRLSEDCERVSGIRLSRNIGRDGGIFAGLAQVTTPLCLVMNFSHPPGLVRRMVDELERASCDLVEGVLSPPLDAGKKHKWLAGLYGRLAQGVTGVDASTFTDLKLFTRKVLNALLKYEGSGLTFREAVVQSGFGGLRLGFPPPNGSAPPFQGRADLLLREMARLTVKHTVKPLALTFAFSLLFFAGALLQGIFSLAGLAFGRVAGRLDFIVFLILLLGAIILFSLGIIGLYVARLCSELELRPPFVVLEKCGGIFNRQ